MGGRAASTALQGGFQRPSHETSSPDNPLVALHGCLFGRCCCRTGGLLFQSLCHIQLPPGRYVCAILRPRGPGWVGAVPKVQKENPVHGNAEVHVTTGHDATPANLCECVKVRMLQGSRVDYSVAPTGSMADRGSPNIVNSAPTDFPHPWRQSTWTDKLKAGC